MDFINLQMIEVIERYSVTVKDKILIINNVPSIECIQCGEKFYLDEMSASIEKIYETAKQIDETVF